ncbi:hypothetical protein PCA31118_04336 [Pandoraea captiosa]|uniref:Uncharacterized protein n=1 Tax=Pandoraea captiosa TaxID=2508302 RepID=A0A5E5AIF5_9BURK|nr:hypothetical protein [Pandoraea captiosa]VVE72867.1 hypothetical protein PCA31118_04336 [Pandoraea captiosa]
MNLKTLQRRFPRIQPIQIEPGNTELIHDDRLLSEFVSADMYAIQQGSWSAQILGVMNCATPSQMLALIDDVIDSHPDYTVGNNYAIVVSYERFHIEIPFGPDLDELRAGPGDYENLVNLLCLIYYYFPLDANFHFQGLDRPILADQPQHAPSWRFQPVASTNREQLITAVRGRQYIPFQQGVGISAPGKLMKFYTSGASHFTNHPGLGTVPGGMRFIDLRAWNGEDHTFTEQELGTIA